MNRDKFLSKYFPEPKTGCWLWVGKTNADGYGELHSEDNEFGLRSAHRYSYTIHHGHIPAKLQVLHKCDQPCCINPDHLFLGTQQENIADMDRKGRRKVGVGVRHSKARVNNEQAIAIKQEYSKGLLKQKDIAEKYGIDRSAVSAIVNNRTWKHVKGIESISKPQSIRGGQKLQPDQIHAIKEACKAGFRQHKIAAYFRVSQAYISQIFSQ